MEQGQPNPTFRPDRPRTLYVMYNFLPAAKPRRSCWGCRVRTGSPLLRHYAVTSSLLNTMRNPYNKPSAKIVTVQGDHSCCSQPPVDTRTKVAFYYIGLTLKWNFCFMSTGGWEQREWSPCKALLKNCITDRSINILVHTKCKMSSWYTLEKTLSLISICDST